MKKLPTHISETVRQALAWLDNMKIPYKYLEAGDFWEFQYKKWPILLMNDLEDNVIGLYSPIIVEGEDEGEWKMTFDFMMSFVDDFIKENDCDVFYVNEGMAQVCQWWQLNTNRKQLKLYKCRFKEMLDKIHKLQWELCLATHEAHEVLFNPPVDVIDVISGNAENQ